MNTFSPLHTADQAQKKGQNLKRLFLIIFVLLLIGSGFLAGFFMGFQYWYAASGDRYVLNTSVERVIKGFDASLYSEVYTQLKNAYVEPELIDDKKLFYGALSGMVDALEDPYTTFLNPEDHDEFNDDLKGSFEGIGAEIGKKDDQIVIIAPLENSPADRAGLAAGDIVLSIDEQDTLGMSLDKAVSLIRGDAGTPVELTLLRQNENSSAFTVAINRERIVIPVVKTTIQDGIAHIELYNFHTESERQFIDALLTLRNQDVKGIILDVRNNPGGLLDKAVAIASAWVEPGEIVVREIFNDAQLNTEHKAIQQVRAPKVATVVLVNEGSASASEIVAGALQDWGLATIVGSKTYGKGSVQDLRTFSDGSGLKVTIAQWITPQGRLINKLGIEPDVAVPYTHTDAEEERDPQLEKAYEVIREKLNQ